MMSLLAIFMAAVTHSANTNAELTFNPDCSMAAGQEYRLAYSDETLTTAERM
jgi:uncharacterized membrane protein YciS (DUF1049 family)